MKRGRGRGKRVKRKPFVACANRVLPTGECVEQRMLRLGWRRQQDRHRGSGIRTCLGHRGLVTVGAELRGTPCRRIGGTCELRRMTSAANWQETEQLRHFGAFEADAQLRWRLCHGKRGRRGNCARGMRSRCGAKARARGPIGAIGSSPSHSMGDTAGRLMNYSGLGCRTTWCLMSYCGPGGPAPWRSMSYSGLGRRLAGVPSHDVLCRWQARDGAAHGVLCLKRPHAMASHDIALLRRPHAVASHVAFWHKRTHGNASHVASWLRRPRAVAFHVILWRRRPHYAASHEV